MEATNLDSLWFATFQSESGTRYLFGPFIHKPTDDEVMSLFVEYSPEEAEYLKEMIANGDQTNPFRYRELSAIHPSATTLF